MADEESMETQETSFDEAPFEQKEPPASGENSEDFSSPPPGANDFQMHRFNGPGPRGPFGGPPPRFGPRGPPRHVLLLYTI